MPALTVRRVPLPDECWRYGDDAAGMMSEWRRLTEACAGLATGELPRLVSRSEFRDFERLVRIESGSAYTFEGSVTGRGRGAQAAADEAPRGTVFRHDGSDGAGRRAVCGGSFAGAGNTPPTRRSVPCWFSRSFCLPGASGSC